MVGSGRLIGLILIGFAVAIVAVTAVWVSFTLGPGPGQWSILELVLHLADSDCISIDRMKRMLTEDNPPLLYADESAYVERLCSHEQSL